MSEIGLPYVNRTGERPEKGVRETRRSAKIDDQNMRDAIESRRHSSIQESYIKQQQQISEDSSSSLGVESTDVAQARPFISKKSRGAMLSEYPKVLARARTGLQEDGIVNLSHMKLGEPLVIALSEGLQQHDLALMCRHIIYRDNRLTDSGIAEICPLLPRSHTLSLDLSENKIRRSGAQALAMYISTCRTIRVLSLDKTFDNDMCLRVLTTPLPPPHVQFPAGLTCLRLSGNKISNEGARLIARFCLSQGMLRELDLSWNEIRGEGGAAIAQGCSHPDSKLEALDISWNALGTVTEGVSESAAAAISSMLATNSTILHLDLGNNHLSARDCQIIGTGLQSNHSVLGMHIAGNAGEHDAYGNLLPNATPWPMEQGHVASRKILMEPAGRAGKSGTRTAAVSQTKHWNLREVCWICGFWRPFRFQCFASTAPTTLHNADGPMTIRGGEKNGSVLFKVSVLTSFDKWQPEALTTTPTVDVIPSGGSEESKAEGSGSPMGQKRLSAPAASDGAGSPMAGGNQKGPKSLSCELYRMAPPGQHYFVYSVDHDGLVPRDDAKRLCWDTSQPSIPSSHLAELNVAVPAELELPPFVNVININKISANETIMGMTEFHSQILPRFKNKGEAPPPQEMEEWSLHDSFFADDRHLHVLSFNSSCFLQDWELSKTAKSLSKNSTLAAKVLNVLKENFQLLNDVFVHYCGAYSAEEGMMTGGAYNELLQRCRLIDLAAIGGNPALTHKQPLPSLDPVEPSPAMLTSQSLDKLNLAASVNEVAAAVVPLSSAVRNSIGSRRSSTASDADVADRRGSKATGSIKMDVMKAVEVAAAAALGIGPVSSTNRRNSRTSTTPPPGSQTALEIQSKRRSLDSTFSSPTAKREVLSELNSRSSLPFGVMTPLITSLESFQSIEESSFSPSPSPSVLSMKAPVRPEGIMPVAHSHNSGKPQPYTCSRADVDMIFIANSISGISQPLLLSLLTKKDFSLILLSGPKSEVNSRRSLCRFQYLDAIVDLSKALFLNKTGTASASTGISQALTTPGGNQNSDVSTAVSKFIREIIEPHAERTDWSFINSNLLLQQSTHQAIRTHMKALQKAFKSNSGIDNTPNETKGMSFKEWMVLCEKSRQLELLGERGVRLAFWRAKAPVPFSAVFLPKNNRQYKQLSFTEFVEAIVHTAFAENDIDIAKQKLPDIIISFVL